MSEYSAKQHLQSFKKEWGEFLAVSPHLALDDTWPSIGVLDLLCFCMRLKEQLPVELDSMLKGSAAYLGFIAKSCWAPSVGDVSVTDGLEGIQISASGGNWIPQGTSVTVYIERELRQRLKEMPFPFPVFTDFKKAINFDSNILSLFGLGLCTGLFPGSEGAWEGMAHEDLQPCVDLAVKELARQSAERYARLFPDEKLGQMAELYLCKIIYPPAMMREELPLLGAVDELCGFFKEYGIPKAAIAQLGKNLSLSPDELLCSVGLVLYAALADSAPAAPQVLSIAHAKGHYCALLRRAMVSVRKQFGMDDDWVEHGLATEEARVRFTLEQPFGFIPWMYLPISRLIQDARTKKLTPLLMAMCDFDLQTAVKCVDGLLEEQMTDLDLRLQRVKLEMVKGDLDTADSMLHNLLSEPGSDESAAFYNLWGMCALGRQKPDAAHNYFRAASAIKNPDPVFRSQVANNFAWTCMAKGEMHKALELVESGLNTAVSPSTLLLNRLSILWQLRRFPELIQTRKMLFALAPTDRRVFGNLTLTEGLLSSTVQ